MSTDLSGLRLDVQQQTKVLTAMLKAMQGGIAVDPTPAVFTVAALPATAATGQWAWASNGRKAGEGAGLGTGLPVYFNPSTATWFTYSGNVVVTA